MKVFPFLILIMLTSSVQAQMKRDLDSLISSFVPENEPGIALQVDVKRSTIYKNSFGLGMPENGTKISSRTNFRLASVSKQFTAMCLLLLEKGGKISLNDPISKFFPKIPTAVSNIVSIKNLMTHSSGIVDYEALMDESISTQLLDLDVLHLLEKQDTTYFKPGSRFRYSNSGYALLALIVEKVSGKTFPKFMEDEIFKPLKMKNSLVYEPGSRIKHRAMGYARDQHNNLYANDQSTTSAVKGDGGVYTSLNDYNKWIKALNENKLLNLADALKRINFQIKESTGSFYGPGWFYFTDSQVALFHSGSTSGFSTFSINIPETGTSIYYFSNIAGNSEPFRKVLEYLRIKGFGDPAKVFELHQLTR